MSQPLSKTHPAFSFSRLTWCMGKGTGKVGSAAVEEKKEEAIPLEPESPGSNGATVKAVILAFEDPRRVGFEDPRRVRGTWDLKQFEKDGKTRPAS